jgi:uncharacterized coiled-coil DUF342 family protein
VQVNEFAKNLREDKVKLPLNDKSKELAAEVKQLKDQVSGLTTGIQLKPVVAGEAHSVSLRLVVLCTGPG